MRTISGVALLPELFTAEATKFVRIARFFVDDRTAAEDLVQEAFIRLARSAHRIRDADRSVAYLRSIVLNLARDHNRRGLVSLGHRPPAEVEQAGVEELVTGRDDQRGAAWCAAGAPRRQRDCLVLRYYLALGVPEIADTLELSPNSVKTHLQRGLRTLESILEDRR